MGLTGKTACNDLNRSSAQGKPCRLNGRSSGAEFLGFAPARVLLRAQIRVASFPSNRLDCLMTQKIRTKRYFFKRLMRRLFRSIRPVNIVLFFILCIIGYTIIQIFYSFDWGLSEQYRNQFFKISSAIVIIYSFSSIYLWVQAPGRSDISRYVEHNARNMMPAAAAILAGYFAVNTIQYADLSVKRTANIEEYDRLFADVSAVFDEISKFPSGRRMMNVIYDIPPGCSLSVQFMQGCLVEFMSKLSSTRSIGGIVFDPARSSTRELSVDWMKNYFRGRGYEIDRDADEWIKERANFSYNLNIIAHTFRVGLVPQFPESAIVYDDLYGHIFNEYKNYLNKENILVHKICEYLIKYDKNSTIWRSIQPFRTRNIHDDFCVFRTTIVFNRSFQVTLRETVERMAGGSVRWRNH